MRTRAKESQRKVRLPQVWEVGKRLPKVRAPHNAVAYGSIEVEGAAPLLQPQSQRLGPPAAFLKLHRLALLHPSSEAQDSHHVSFGPRSAAGRRISLVSQGRGRAERALGA